MKCTILKFGGTSLTDERLRNAALATIRKRLDQGFKPVVVVSAIGRGSAPYSTDGLLTFSRGCVGELSSRSEDLIMSCGEVVSAAIFAQYLENAGLPSIALTGPQAGIVTSGHFTKSTIVGIGTNRLLNLLDDGIIPVVAGFQGATEDGDISTIGRGGSDTTACALGAVLDAASVEIYTDVDGVMTGDPKLVSDAGLLSEIDYAELQALSVKGARVMHSAAVAYAAERNVPITIRGIGSDYPGTTTRFVKPKRPVTGVASITDITHFQVALSADLGTSPTSETLVAIADQGISIHFIDFRPDEMRFVVDNKDAAEVVGILDERQLDYSTERRFTKVSVVGVGMTGQPGMMSTVLTALETIGIRVHQATDSATSISCLVREEDAVVAGRALHDAFNLKL